MNYFFKQKPLAIILITNFFKTVIKVCKVLKALNIFNIRESILKKYF